MEKIINEEDILNIENTVGKAESFLTVLKDACITNELFDEQEVLEYVLLEMKQIREGLSFLHCKMMYPPSSELRSASPIKGEA